MPERMNTGKIEVLHFPLSYLTIITGHNKQQMMHQKLISSQTVLQAKFQREEVIK